MFSKKIFLIIIFLLPFSFALNLMENFDLAIFRLIIPLFFLVWLLGAFLNKKFLIDTRPRFFFLIFFVLICAFSFFWAENQSKALRKIIFILSFLPLYFVSFQILKEKILLNKFLKILFWSVFVLSICGILQFLMQFVVGIDAMLEITKTINPFFLGKNFSQVVQQYPSWMINLQGKTLLRAYGIFPDPHLFSLYLNISLPLIFYIYFKNKQKIYLLGLISVLSASLLSFARASLISLIAVAALAFLFYLFRDKKKFKKRFAFFILGSIVIFAVFLTPNPISHRFLSSFNFQEGSIQGRLEMWETGYELAKEKPLGGVGLGNFSHHLKSGSELRNPAYAHNLFLDFAAETGILGALFLILILFCPVAALAKSPRKAGLLSYSLAFSFLIVIFQGMFETPFFSVRVFPLILILLSIDARKNN